MIGEVLQQRVAILRQPEEEVLLLDPLRRQRRMERALAVDEVLLLLEGFTRDAVPALVDTFVDVAPVVADLRELLHRRPVSRFRRADEVVERAVQLLPD